MYLECLIELISSRHDYQDIDIAVSMWSPISMRAEQNDLVGMKSLSDLPREPADDGARNLFPAIPAGRLGVRRSAVFGAHVTILQQWKTPVEEKVDREYGSFDAVRANEAPAPSSMQHSAHDDHHKTVKHRDDRHHAQRHAGEGVAQDRQSRGLGTAGDAAANRSVGSAGPLGFGVAPCLPSGRCFGTGKLSQRPLPSSHQQPERDRQHHEIAGQPQHFGPGESRKSLCLASAAGRVRLHGGLISSAQGDPGRQPTWR